MTANSISSQPASAKSPDRPAKKTVMGDIMKILFWGWNLFYLALVLLGFAPLELPRLIRSVQDGITPAIYLVESLIIILIPVVVTAVALIFLRNDAEGLFALGYVVEWPVMLVLLVRFFVIREGNPAIIVLLAWLAVAELCFLWYLLDRSFYRRRAASAAAASAAAASATAAPAPSAPHRPGLLGYAQFAGLSLLFAGTLYAASWLIFYVPPLATAFWDILKNTWGNISHIAANTVRSQWYLIPLSVLSNIVMIFSLALLLVMPVAGPVLAGRAWWKSLRARLDGSFSGAGRAPAVLAAALLPLALVIAVLITAMRQPQKTAFSLLQEPPTSPQQAQALVRQEQTLRAGLVNAYLASYRYLGSAGEINHIRDLYIDLLDMQPETAWEVERVYESLMKPFLYQPVHPLNSGTRVNFNNQSMPKEQREAAKLYEQYFDQPISDGERPAIINAVRSTPDRTTAELAWQAVDDREVHLNLQEVTVTEHGDWADVMLHEAYANLTTQRQEVVYYFSLPESAVITGLWLGASPDRALAFPFQVAPRGAAQAVYRQEVRYMRDPALVEQIGPRQYRLRAFPVEPGRWDSTQRDYTPGPEMHLWMSYRTMSAGGAWPLPRLAERRNVYWDNRSKRSLNGHSIAGAETDWLPLSVQASQPVVPTAHRIDFAGGISVMALPAAEMQPAALPSGLRAAVVLDRSFSMRDRAGEVTQAFAALDTALAARPDIYLTASKFRGEAPARLDSAASFDPAQVLYLGGQNAAELLAQYESLSAGQKYDLVIVLTDGSGYELGDGKVKIAVPDAPLWVVHLGGGFPMGYDDATQQAIQASGGGAAASVEEALARYAASRDNPGRADRVDGYTWLTLAAGETAPASAPSAETGGFSALAARRVMLAEMAKNRGKLDELPILDSLNALAIKEGIVTPYSSMIVLVNEKQRAALEGLSQDADRYAREVEAVGLTEENMPMGVTGVPEPEEWLLMALAAALLLYANRHRLGSRLRGLMPRKAGLG